MRRMVRAIISLTLVASLFVTAEAHRAIGLPQRFRWTVTDLGAFDPRQINNKGEIAGNIRIADILHAFLYRDGQLVALGNLGGDAGTTAYALNEETQVVGSSPLLPGVCCTNQLRGFIWDDGVMSALSALQPTFAGSMSVATDIDDAGVVVGWSTGPEGLRPVMWKNGEIATFGDFSGAVSAMPSAIGDGFIVGNYFVEPFNRGWRYRDGNVRDLGSLGGGVTVVADAEGAFTVGWSTIPGDYNGYTGPQHAYRYVGNRMTDLGTLGFPESFAYSVNRSGVVVGEVHGIGDPNTDIVPVRPFIYIGDRMRFLDELADSGSLELRQAISINDSNEIVGLAWLRADGNIQVHGYLLTPVAA